MQNFCLPAWKWRLLVLLLLLSFAAHAQLSITTRVANDSMQIGDVNQFRIKISYSSNITITSIDLQPLAVPPYTVETLLAQDTSLANDPQMEQYAQQMFDQMGLSDEAMEITNFGKWENPGNEMMLRGSEASNLAENVGELMMITNDISFRFFEEGLHGIASPIVEYLEDGVQKRDSAAVVELLVGSPIFLDETPVDSLQIAPIKNILDEPIDWWRDRILPYGSVLLGILILIGLIYFLSQRAKRRVPPPKPVVIIPAHEIALKKLNILKEEQLWQKGAIKTYQSNLTHIIREYLENRYGIQALENTTSEIGRDLKKLDLDTPLQMDLKNILQVADLVKFAKAKPGADIHEQFMDKAYDFVEATKKIEIPKDSEEK